MPFTDPEARRLYDAALKRRIRAEARATEAPADSGWMTRAGCRGLDPEMFFPYPGESAHEALAVCVGCAVRADCLAYALDTSQHHGIWGGTSERERRRIREQRAAAASSDGAA